MSVSYVVSPASGDSSATVFSSSDLTGKMGTLSKGTTITVTGSGSNYYKINYGSSGSGTPSSGTVKANGGLNARESPSTSATKVGAFNNGATLTIHSSQSGWYEVSGTSGWGTLTNVWVSSQYVTGTSDQGYGYLSKTDVKAQTGESSSSSSSSSSSTNRSYSLITASANTMKNGWTSSYANNSDKRYLGTDEYYKTLMSTLNYCFGTPPKYNMDIDIQYVSDVGLGRVLSQTYYSNPTVLSICPGKVKMFPQLFNAKARDQAFNSLYQAASGDSSVMQKIMGDKDSDILNGPLYEFSQDTQDYAKRLNLLCRTCAILLGIGDERMPYTATPLKKFDYAYWSIRKKYAPSTGKVQNVFTDFWTGGFQAVTGAITDENYVHFLMSTDNTSVSESVSTSVESSFLDNIVSSTNSIANQLSYFSGVGFNNQMDAKANIDNALNGIIGESGWTKLVDNVLSGGKLKIPKIVGDTDFNQSISCSLTFMSPYGSPKSVFLWCIVPVCHLFAFALPKQLSDSMYSYPYILKVYQKGWFNSNLAVMSSINLTRGGADNTSWSSAGLATEWTVNFEITPLYSQLTLPSTDHPLLFMRNDGLIDYLGNLCGFDLKADNLSTKANLLASFIANSFTDIPNDIQRWVSDGISDSIAAIFQM